MNKKLLVLSMVLFMTQNLFAFTGAVGIQIIQHDPYVDDVRAASETMESVILDTFFDSGLVVSNSPVVSKKDDSKDESIIKGSLKEALEGRMDFLIVVMVNYNTDASPNPNAEYLSHIKTVSWKVINVTTQRDIARKDYEIENSKAKGNNKDGVKKFSSDIAWDMLMALKKLD